MGGHSNNPFARQSSQQQQTGADDDDDASTTRMYARLCETQEASLRQALEEKEAAVTRLRENESTVKELVDAMDEAVKAQGTQRCRGWRCGAGGGGGRRRINLEHNSTHPQTHHFPPTQRPLRRNSPPCSSNSRDRFLTTLHWKRPRPVSRPSKLKRRPWPTSWRKPSRT